MENPGLPIQVVTAGEALIDMVERPDGTLDPCVGGAVYNLARALALQGVPTAYLNWLSNDAFGQELAQGLEQAGVFLARTSFVSEPTCIASVALDAEGKAEYVFQRVGVADRVGGASDLIEATQQYPNARFACTGSLAITPEERTRYLAWLESCSRNGCMVVIDANLRPSSAIPAQAYRESVFAALSLADVIKVSDDDLAALWPDVADPLETAARLFTLSKAKAVALTLGAKGAVLLNRDGRSCAARESAALQIVDTVGAGDCFLAGLLAELADQRAIDSTVLDVREAMRRQLERAIASASFCVQRAGCSPPTLLELNHSLKRKTVLFA